MLGGNGDVQKAHSTAEMPWSTGLFSCHENLKNALLTTVLPCVTFGQIAEIVDEGETNSAKAGFFCCMTANIPCWGKLKGCKYRAKLRRKFNLVEEPLGDSLSHVLCPLCSLCQEFRELENRGLDPSLGWEEASIVAQNKIPPVNQTMFK
ncbi:protein PLANT CADMIUM RESISTANCE 8-like [Papaver somniferum]|uniref:protein PLANT CADMIUM RESISTANCE 8-like n=1 Tax=Papaver somniferum TaxID=3469 RepID=UPI000E6F5DCF|nr:protein PLANT CADMIUM RESISTANCE 8-like [Papaver somniferum]